MLLYVICSHHLHHLDDVSISQLSQYSLSTTTAALQWWWPSHTAQLSLATVLVTLGGTPSGTIYVLIIFFHQLMSP